MSPRVGTSTTDDRKVELTFWARELQDAPALDARTGDGAVRAAAPDEVELLLEAKGAERRDEALRWLACGHRPYVALTRGAVRAYGWVASTDVYIGDLERDIHLVPGEAYIFDCETQPAYRRRGFYSAILRRIIHDLAAARLRRAWIGAVADNLASQHGIRRAGFTHVANLVYRRAGPNRTLL